MEAEVGEGVRDRELETRRGPHKRMRCAGPILKYRDQRRPPFIKHCVPGAVPAPHLLSGSVSFPFVSSSHLGHPLLLAQEQAGEAGRGPPWKEILCAHGPPLGALCTVSRGKSGFPSALTMQGGTCPWAGRAGAPSDVTGWAPETWECRVTHTSEVAPSHPAPLGGGLTF